MTARVLQKLMQRGASRAEVLMMWGAAPSVMVGLPTPD